MNRFAPKRNFTQNVRSKKSESDSRRRPSPSNQGGLNQQLSDESQFRRADCQPGGDFTPARDVSRAPSSRLRSTHRASSTLATLAQAISKTSTAMPPSITENLKSHDCLPNLA